MCSYPVDQQMPGGRDPGNENDELPVSILFGPLFSATLGLRRWVQDMSGITLSPRRRQRQSPRLPWSSRRCGS